MATAKYELMEKYSKIRSAEIGDAKEYLDNEMTELVNPVRPFYNFEIENSSQFIDKNEVTYEQVFAHLNNLSPNRNNVFLFNKKLK